MRTVRPLAIALVALTSFSACSGGPTGPSTPPLRQSTERAPEALPTPTPPAPPQVTGTFTLTSIAPESGATVLVRDCAGTGLSRPRPAHFLNICTDELRLTVDVLVDQDLPNAILTVDFWNGAETCGGARIPRAVLSAGQRASFTTSVVNLSSVQLPDQPEYLVCPPPALTTGITLRLRVADHPHTDLLRQEYDRTYTFAMR